MRKYLLFLLWHDNQVQPLTKYLLITLASLTGAIWAFPLENFSPEGFLSPQCKFQLRILFTVITVLMVLVAFIILSIVRYKKYSKAPKLLNHILILKKN